MGDRPKTNIEQLDLLRGLAIILMIVNHAGVRLLDPESQQQGPIAALVFLGSFAPVVFFFTTGFGVGIGKRGADWAGFASTLLKGGLLFVADQFMFWKDAIPWGLDFLGFIALSSVFVTAVAASRRPVLICVALIVSVLSLRFGFGPSLRNHLHLTGFVGWFIGVSPVANVSYAFSPWIVYPLLGFVMARRYRSVAGTTTAFLWPWGGVAAIGALAGAAAMYLAHASFFRWGTMSLGFFVLSIGVGLVCVIAAWRITARCPLVARLLSMRGVASFAVVPIHYALIEFFALQGGTGREVVAILVAMGGLVVFSFTLSRTFAAGVNRWVSIASQAVVWYSFIALVVLCGTTIWLLPRPHAVVFAAFVVGQLAIAALLAARDYRRFGASLANKSYLHASEP